MWIQRIGVAAALCGALSLHAARAADPASVQTPIKGSDVMGDKGRSGPDGWSWAPVTRDQAPAGKAPGETTAAVHGAPNAMPSSGAGKSLPPGQDPGTPAATQAGPGQLAGGADARKP